MASIMVTGTNYCLKDGTINFFGAMGKRSGAGNKWYSNLFMGNEKLMFEITKTDKIHDWILECIVADTEAGNEIAYLIVGIRTAVLLYLSDIITAEHLHKVSEGEDYVEIPDVAFENLSLTVRVEKGRTEFFCATTDKNRTDTNLIIIE